MSEIITISKNEKYGTMSVDFHKNKIISKGNEINIDGIRSYTTIVSDEVFKILQGNNWREECDKILSNALQ